MTPRGILAWILIVLGAIIAGVALVVLIAYAVVLLWPASPEGDGRDWLHARWGDDGVTFPSGEHIPNRTDRKDPS
jgi:hypothetical protein